MKPTDDELVAMIERCIVDAAVWEHRLDGVPALRVITHDESHVCAWFRVYEISQRLHVGCLELHLGHDGWRTKLFLDPLASSTTGHALTERQRRHVYETGEDPSALMWEHVLPGPV